MRVLLGDKKTPINQSKYINTYQPSVSAGAEIKELTVLQAPPTAYQPEQPIQPEPPVQPSPWAPQAAQQQPVETPQQRAASFGSNPWGQQAAAQVQPAPAPPPRAQEATQTVAEPGMLAPAPAPTMRVAAAEGSAPRQQKPLSYAAAAGGTTTVGGGDTTATTAPGAQHARHHGQQKQANGGRHGHHHRGGRHGGRGAHHHPRPPPRPPAPVVSVPNEEFDFEAELEKFDKQKLLEEAGHALSQEQVYKKDDFFDTLSCDALERQNGTADRQNRRAMQRRTDVATFGSAAGRGRSTRGRRGRGGHHGGRGGGYHTEQKAEK